MNLFGVLVGFSNMNLGANREIHEMTRNGFRAFRLFRGCSMNMWVGRLYRC